MNMVVRIEDLLDAAATVLLRRPDATLQTIAYAAGISRTTIFNHFRTREALIDALAVDTLDRMRAGISTLDFSVERSPSDVVEDLWRVVQPMSDRTAFLRSGVMQESHEVTVGWAEAFTPWGVYVATLHAMGRVRNDLPLRWLIGSLVGLLFVAFDEVDAGELGTAEAGRIVAASWVALAGAQGPPITANPL